MSIIKITKENVERYSLRAEPARTYKSASLAMVHVTPSGITGALPLFADGSSAFKDVFSDVGLNADPANDEQVENLRAAAVEAASNSINAFGAIDAYISKVHGLVSSSQFDKKQNVIRFEPGIKIDKNFQRKRVTKTSLFPFYRHAYPTLQWAYSNYHSLNFVTSSYLPENTCLIYPAGTGTVALEDTNVYAPSSSFTFDFYVNPRYTTENVGDEYRPGTIFHMSSSYAISLVTGSSISSKTAKPDGFRLLLQLSQSAEIKPSEITISGDSVTAPGATADPGFLFMSDDNSLSFNKWHHIAVRWGGENVARGTGSFVIDGQEKGTFPITSASVMQPIVTSNEYHDADALFIGNFYDGSNYDTKPIAGYFNPTAHRQFGVLNFNDDDGATDPTDSSFSHPLNAEVHDLKIYDNYRSNQQILTSSMKGAEFSDYYIHGNVTGTDQKLSGSSANDGLLFYVPPFFVKAVQPRYVNQTPFFYTTGTTNDPFNVAMSFGVGGHELNIQNFTREFVRGTTPRHLGLETSQIDSTTITPKSANYWIYESGSHRKRNLSILPCDNGRFTPNFKMLLSGNLDKATSGSILDKFRNDFGNIDLSLITLENLVSTEFLPKFDDQQGTAKLISGSIVAPLIGPTPEDPAVSPANILTILQRTKDPSSNEVVFFDVSNMFYGDQLKPKSIVLKDLAVTGSNGRVQITLKDDGYGNLYRADSEGSHATWASVGNVIYEEGILVVKSPNLPMFGSDAWEISFEGQRNIHVLEVNVPVDKGFVNSSPNPTYQDMVPSDYPNETAKSFVYLTGMQFHDENLNVVGRANFAQPAIKRDGDRYVVRVRLDY
jgi:hypothetical protein